MHRQSFTVGILAISACAFLAPADDGKGGTNPEPNAEEPKTLPQAKARLADLEGQLATATQLASTETARADKAEGQVKTLEGQFSAATDEATKARAELATANESIKTLTGERDTARTELADSQKNVTRLEALCGVKGVNAADAVPAAGSEKADSSVDALRDRLAAETDPKKRYAIAEQIRAKR